MLPATPYCAVKRFLDFSVASAGLLLTSPLLMAISLAIKLDSRGPVFYRGERVGLHGVNFQILKFRTMVTNAESLGGSSSPDDDPRITRVGKWLRRHKLDELPQMFNVCVGDMSLVGPRPQVRWAVDLYSERERRLLSVRPGITDYASIEFRNEGEILRGSADPDRTYLEKIAPRKICLSLQYIEERSLLVDAKVVFNTLLKVVQGASR